MAPPLRLIPWIFGANDGRSSLRKDFAWTFTGNMIYSGSQWGALVLLAKMGTPEIVGKYALGLAISAPVLMGASLQLRSVQASDVKDGHPFSDYLGFRLLWTMMALAVIIATPVFTRAAFDTAVLVAAVGVAQCIEAVSDIYYGNLQLLDHMDRIAKSMIIRGPLGLASLALGFQLTHDVVWGVTGLILARLAVLFGYDARPAVHDSNASAMRPRIRPRVQGELLRIAFPLGVVGLLVSLNSNIPRYFIEHHMGARELGIFSAIAFLLSAGNIVVGALGQSAFVPLARRSAEGDTSAFNALVYKLVAIGVLLGAGGMAFAAVAGKPLLTLLYRPEYAEQSHLLVWMMGAAGVSFVGQFLGYSMTAARHFAVQIPLFALLVITTTTASYVFVPVKGLLGAILALLVTGVVQVAGSVLILYAGRRKRHSSAVEAVQNA